MAVLLAAEARRQVTDTLSAMRFGEQGGVLAPAARSALVEALMPLLEGHRTAVLEAVKAQQLRGTRGAGLRAAEESTGDTLMLSEESQVRALADPQQPLRGSEGAVPGSAPATSTT